MLSTTHSYSYASLPSLSTADLLVREHQTPYRKYSNKTSANLACIKNLNLSLLQERLAENNPSPIYNTKLAKFMLVEMLQKNINLPQISDSIQVSTLTLKNCLVGKTNKLSRKSFLKILEFYIKHQ